MSAQRPILEVENLDVVYETADGPFAAVRDASFTLARGEALGLVGESGSGKTTIALAVVRYLAENARIAGGTIRFDGIDVTRLGTADLRRLRGNRIAMVYQDPAAALNPALRVGDQVAEVFRTHTHVDRSTARQRSIEMLRRVHLADAEHAYERYAHEFSGGQQQRIVIAMALAAEPDLLILDEPTTGLDVTVEAEIVDLFNELRQVVSAAILFISHDIALISETCERIGVLHNGAFVEIGDTAAVLSAPSDAYTRRLLECLVPFGATKHDQRLAAVDDQPATVQLADAEAGITGRAATPLLEARGLAKDYRRRRGSVRVVDGVDVDVPRGRIVGIVGESGSGKTTTARMIAGLVEPSEGTVWFDARDVTQPVHRRPTDVRRSLQMVFQNPDATLNPAHNVRRVLRRTLRKLVGLRGQQLDERVAAILEAVRLEPRLLGALPDQLSGGQKQRVAIARAFAANPALILCDEPTSALDVSVQATILNLLVDLQRREGTSYVFISHDLSTVRYLADDVLVMYFGTVVEMGPAARVFSPPLHPYTETLVSAIRRIGGNDYDRIRPRPANDATGLRPSGCPFHPRCPRKVGPECEEEPPWQVTAEGHRYRCVIPPDDLREAQTRVGGS